jgi:hypothetical protein
MASNSAGVGGLLPPQTTSVANYILTTDGQTASWEVSSASLPTQTGHSGEYLTTDGSVASWGAVTADSLLPTQTAKSGYFLTTNGTTVSWGISLTALLPNQATHSGDVLSTNGSGTLSWVSASGVALAAVGSTPNADGATLAANTLNLEPADATHPGVVTTGAQVWAGNKTIAGFFFDAGTGTTMSGGNAYVQFASGNNIIGSASGGKVQLQDFGTDRLVLQGGVADFTGLGTGGQLKLKDDAGVVKTCTISGGVWVIS